MALSGSTSGGAAVAANALQSFEILGPTPLLDATGDYGDATTRPGVNGGGWVAKATMPYLVAQTFDPTKMLHTVTDPGNTASGTTTATRVVQGGAILRRQYNAMSSKQQANDGVTITIYYSLEEDVYQTSTVTRVEALTGYYGTSPVGVYTGAIVNSSTAVCEDAFMGWLQPQYLFASDPAGFQVELAAYHLKAQSGRQVARVEFTATDSSGHTSATVTVSATSPSSFQTQGPIVDAWKATIPTTALTQGDLCFVNAVIYYWIGGSLNAATSGANASGAVTSATPITTLRFVCDKAGTYAGCANRVAQTGTSGVTIITSAADTSACGNGYAAALATGKAYSSIDIALTAAKNWNTANKTGNATHSGATIYMMETALGVGANHTTANSGVLAGMNTITAGNSLTKITKDPAATGAVKVTMAVVRTTADKLWWNIDIDHTAGNGLDGGANSNTISVYDGMTLNLTGSTATVAVNYRNGLTYVRNVTMTGIASGKSALALGSVMGNGGARKQHPLYLGVVCTDAAADVGVYPYVMVGCRLKRFFLAEYAGTITTTTFDSQDGFTVANNEMLDVRSTSQFAHNVAYNIGLNFTQNVMEASNPAPAGGILRVGGDSSGAYTIRNLLMQHNTIPGSDGGARCNHLYVTVDATVGISKNGNDFGNIFYELNRKSDGYPNDSAMLGRNGNWRSRYSGFDGNVVVNGATNVGPAPANDGLNWMADYIAASNGYLLPVAFVSNLSGTGGGGGDYRLTGSTNNAYGRVLSGKSRLATDLAGVARPTSGVDASGAYTRTA